MKGTPDWFGWRVPKDGSRFWTSLRIDAFREENDKLIGCATFTQDPSMQHRRNELFRQAVEAAPNAMVMINAAGRIEMVNTQTERVFGYTRDELLDRPVEMLLPARFRERHPDLRTAYFAAPVSRPMGAGRDLYALRKDGTEFPVEIGLNTIQTDEGTMIVSAVVDISDRKQKEARILAALQEKNVLLGEIHHRVKNNLQIVDSLLDLQSSNIESQEALDLLRESRNRVKSMALIHQLLYMSNDLVNVDFRGFLDSIVPVLVSAYGTDTALISLSIDAAEVRLPINAAVPCGLVVNELISNALKHAFPANRRGEIRIEIVNEPNDHVVLIVSDDGVGIPDCLDLEQTTTLGLQLVTLLADQLKADINIRRSQPTRFTLRFPVPRQT